jgi:hypothetical protein
MQAVTFGDEKGTRSLGVEAFQNFFSYKTEEIKGYYYDSGILDVNVGEGWNQLRITSNDRLWY